MNLPGALLRMAGWSVEVTVPDYPKCIICVAPHTSNWDFVVGKLAYASVGRKAGFLMKESWFFWPLGCIFRALGGVPVPRGRKSGSLTAVLTKRFEDADHLVLAITPEGTRSRTTDWHTGFLRIARQAGIPVVLGVIDYASKKVLIEKTFRPTGNLEADMRAIKDYYKPYSGLHPDNFSAQ